MKKKMQALPGQLEQLLRVLPASVYLLDGSGVVIYTNPVVFHHTGWEAEQLQGQSIVDSLVFALPFRSTILATVRAAESWDGVSERIIPDGILRSVEAHWQHLSEPIGAAQFIGMEYDISEYLARDLELQQSRKLAKIGILAEGIAHELRNPLSYALSAAQLLQEDSLEDEVRAKCIQTITTGIKKAGVIVENMLALGKPRGQFPRQRVNLSQVIIDAIEAASSHANFTDVRIFNHVPVDNLFVAGNHDMLVQVLHNIITNALNEMPERGGITIQGRKEGDSIRVSLQDTGPGISEEQIEKLFDPFYSASHSGSGTGLGLTLSQYIMKEHSGSIEVISDSGDGATFVLTFPSHI